MSVFQHDHTLPALPLPPLGQSCRVLKEMIEPLVPQSTWLQSCAALDAFARPGGEGEALQALLQSWAAARAGNGSWLRPIWDDNYLACRLPLPLNISYALEFNAARWGEDPLARLVAGLTHIWLKLQRQALPPEEARTGFLSMDMLRHTIYTRLPLPESDLLYYPPAGAPPTAAVVCRGNWYLLALTAPDGAPCGQDAIAAAFARVRKLAGATNEVPIGALTTAPRGQAAQLRQGVAGHPQNRMNLEDIENASFVICLDEPEDMPATPAMEWLSGPAANRWFDKSLQIISPGKGALGACFEHAGCDAGIWVYLLGQVDALLAENPTLPGSPGAEAHLRPLAWQIGPALSQQLAAAAQQYHKTAGRIQVAQQTLPPFSRTAIKAKKCSPDLFVQLAFQAAYYQLTGHLHSVYEAVSVRNFYEGRTECVRPVTAASAAFVKALAGGNLSKESAANFWAAAAMAQKKQVTLAQSGGGPQRHIAGLAAMARMHGLAAPALLQDEGFAALGQDKLSTSSITAPYIDFFSFGAVLPEGLGLGYGIREDALHLAVTAGPACGVHPKDFIQAVQRCGAQMLALLD